MSAFSNEFRATYAKLADYLIPEYNGKPAASAVGVHLEMLDEVMRIRPDLEDGFRRAVEACAGQDASAELNALARSDSAAFAALTTVATGGYMMTDEAREAVGYPGQDAAPYDVTETPEYLTNGMLQRVIDRGPIFRDTRHLK
ncbi:hypothetical protein C8N32_1287 [Rhodovulum imhoffii]|uniref:Gluconate 2-dehydrogenase subunit 3-like protein n=1 Tax=Rhodovulum imhoffii TaxID=365340 RepID=A0A2T5BNQ9_9RHOB|nr:hypothetical protein [Rhodovulum imhoffii]MBK5933614.1 hypothetical protein [Rhodovulum imhoffii]PTN00614.1 hypothetical protein C8N32_1287 [Rhodovulum imhoffii]